MIFLRNICIFSHTIICTLNFVFHLPNTWRSLLNVHTECMFLSISRAGIGKSLKHFVNGNERCIGQVRIVSSSTFPTITCLRFHWCSSWRSLLCPTVWLLVSGLLNCSRWASYEYYIILTWFLRSKTVPRSACWLFFVLDDKKWTVGTWSLVNIPTLRHYEYRTK
jgi:hypothetical protein